MSDAIDVTEVMLRESTLPQDIAAFRQRCLKNPLVKTCDVEITRVLARPLGGRMYEMRIEGSLALKTNVLVSIALKGGGGGALDAGTRQLEIKDITFEKDSTGVVSRVLQMSGYAVGRKIRVAKKDISVLERVIPNGDSATI